MDPYINPQRDENNPDFWVIVTSYDGVRYYGYTSVDTTIISANAGPVTVNQASPLVGTFDGSPLYEINGNLIPIGSRVKVRRAYWDPELDWVYVTEFFKPATATVRVLYDIECIDGILYKTYADITGDNLVITVLPAQ